MLHWLGREGGCYTGWAGREDGREGGYRQYRLHFALEKGNLV